MSDTQTIVLTEEQIRIMAGLVCPYCKQISELISSRVVYGKDYGMIYRCQKCDAYVGCHKGTTTAKGRLANAKLRKLKKTAHSYFDKIWQLGLMSRTEAYQWLSGRVNLPAEYTHIGMFGEKTCEDVIEFCKQALNDNRRIDLDFGKEPITPFYK